jgi:glycosyltransferase involved in cell wall biosynthesis
MDEPESPLRSEAQPLVTLVVPTRNRCDLLKETLTSFLGQTYQRWEAIVVDDESSDDTAEMVADLSAIDPRVRLIRRDRPPQGAQACRNIGIASAAGEYVIIFDSDDLMASQCLERRVEFMKANPDLDFAVFQARMFETVPGDLDRVWNCDTGEDPLDRFLRGDTPWWTGSPIWRGEVLKRAEPWDEELLCAQDQDFHTRALLAGLRYQWIAEVDVFVRTKQTGHESIGSHWRSREHLLSQWTRIRKQSDYLRSRGMLVGSRRTFVAGNYFWVAAALARYADGKMTARQVWAECRAAGLIDASTYALGWLYLAAAATPARRFPLWLIHHLWSEDMFVYDRGLARDTPLELQHSPAAALAYAQHNRRARQPPIVREGLVAWIMRRVFTGSRLVQNRKRIPA